MKDKKEKISLYVGIACSTIGIIVSILAIIINTLKKESVGVGIGLLIFCFLSLTQNINK